MESSPKTSKWKTLLGFFREDEALNIVKGQGVSLTPDEEQKLSGQIHEAISYVNSLQGRSDLKINVSDIPPDILGNRGSNLEADPTFHEHTIGMTKHTFAMIDLKNLRTFQPNLNFEYVEGLKQNVPALEDTQGLLRYCLPLRSEIPKIPVLGGFNPATNTFTFATENLDTRILGSVQGEEPTTGRSFFGIVYGRGLPQMSVVKYKGMYMLKNGYHRAYALLEKGHKSVPCILLETDNYTATGATGPGFFGIDIMTSKSPILSDFSSLAAVVYSRRLVRMIVSVHGEVQVVPV